MRLLVFIFLIISIDNSYSHGTINITNVKNDIGYIDLSIYDNEVAFYGKSDPIVRIKKIATKGLTSIPLSNLHEGKVSIFVFHDQNEDFKFNQGFLWKNLEGFAYSNNYIPKSKPIYLETIVELKHNVPLKLNLIY